MRTGPPAPDQTPAERDLAALVSKWAERHQLPRAEELRLLARVLARRCDVAAAIDRVKELPPAPWADGEPRRPPVPRGAAFDQARPAGPVLVPTVLAAGPVCGHCGAVMARDTGAGPVCVACE